MSKSVVEFPDRSAIKKEAALWVVKLDGDDAPSREDLASLREWVERSPVHRGELGRLTNFWGKMNVLTDLAVPLSRPERDVQHVFFGVSAHCRVAGLAVAASVVLLGFALGFNTLFGEDPYFQSNGRYATAVGEQRSTTLADGSVIQLNTDSEVEVSYGNKFRELRLLQGEAHFTVAKNAERPFRVYAGNGRVEAVGTAFSVYLKDDAVNVTVTEGRVSVAARDKRSSQMIVATADTIVDDFVEVSGNLMVGQSAVIGANIDIGSSGSLEIIDLIVRDEPPLFAKELSWRNGALMFTGDPLEEVVREISRYTSVTIEISDPSIRSILIGGRFPLGETEAMLDSLVVNFGLRVTYLDHDRVLLSAAE